MNFIDPDAKGITQLGYIVVRARTRLEQEILERYAETLQVTQRVATVRIR